jgi:hypothetical protein
MIDSTSGLKFVTFLLKLSEFCVIFHFEKALYHLIVDKFRYIDDIVQKVCKNSHSLFNVSLGSFCSFLFWDWRDYLSWIHFSQKVSKPHEITVSSSDEPSHLMSSNFKLQKGCCSYSEKSTNCFPLRAT